MSCVGVSIGQGVGTRPVSGSHRRLPAVALHVVHSVYINVDDLRRLDVDTHAHMHAYANVMSF